MLPLLSTIIDCIHPAHEANPWIVQSRNWLQPAHAEILSNRVSLRFRFSVRSDQARVWVFGVGANICKLGVCGFCKEAQTSALVNPPCASLHDLQGVQVLQGVPGLYSCESLLRNVKLWQLVQGVPNICICEPISRNLEVRRVLQGVPNLSTREPLMHNLRWLQSCSR